MPRKFKIVVPILCLLSPTILSAQDDFNLDTEDKKYSYAVGASIGQRMIQQFASQPGIQVDALLRGLNAGILGEDELLSAEEIQLVIEQKQQSLLAEAAAKSEEKVAAGLAFLEENKSKEGVIVTESGLQYSVIESGEGDSPAVSDTVVVHYEGTLVDGTVFDSSYSRGEPASFSLQSIIPGWAEALQLMKAGDKWAVVLPSELAYGERGAGQLIGPNEVLKFDIELLEVKKSAN